MELTGAVDLHLHAGPDVRPRRLDDVELARAAKSAGLRAILIKSHHTVTADRAALAEKLVGGIRVFGGVALNAAVGGLNADAVDFALRLGAKQIWMPTVSARAEHAVRPPEPRRKPPVEVLDTDGALRDAAREVLALVRDADAILGTGHLDRAELRAVVKEARDLGLRKLLVTHPEHPLLDLTVSEQRELAALGVCFERCFCFTVGAIPGRPVPFDAIAAAIRGVGVASTVLSSDLGRLDLPDPIEGLGEFWARLVRFGFAPDEVRRMGATTPAELLDI